MAKTQDDTDRLKALLPALQIRSKVLAAIRQFFLDRDFIEVETPVRLPAPALEPFIDAEPSGDWYLRTSPELHMKRLLVAGQPRIFQMGPCFRQGESGPIHSPEYTMLEWYRADADYMDMLVDTKALIGHVAKTVVGLDWVQFKGRRLDLVPNWVCRTVRDAFLEYAGWDPIESFDQDRFDVDMVEKVEPALAKGPPAVLKDFPIAMGALARPGSDPRVAERWELYIAGMEIANAFSELTDMSEQRKRFEECAEGRTTRGAVAYPIDHAFLDALKIGLPRTGGIALGVDRLVMLMCGVEWIDRVRAFSGDSI